jgi:hypothetical protein
MRPEFMSSKKDDGWNNAKNRDIAKDRGRAVAHAFQKIGRFNRLLGLGSAAVRAERRLRLYRTPAVCTKGHVFEPPISTSTAIYAIGQAFVPLLNALAYIQNLADGFEPIAAIL